MTTEVSRGNMQLREKEPKRTHKTSKGQKRIKWKKGRNSED